MMRIWWTKSPPASGALKREGLRISSARTKSFRPPRPSERPGPSGHARQVLQRRVEDHHQAQKQRQLRSVAAHLPMLLRSRARRTPFTQACRATHAARLLAWRQLAIESPAAFAAAVPAQPAPALYKTE